MIDKVAGASPVNSLQGAHRVSEANAVKAGSDSISVSREAQEMAAVYYADKVAAETPDVRADKVAYAKSLLANPNWPDAHDISGAVDGLMKAFGI